MMSASQLLINTVLLAIIVLSLCITLAVTVLSLCHCVSHTLCHWFVNVSLRIIRFCVIPSCPLCINRVKTGDSGLPILQSLLHNPQGLFALILSPTRELAFQISEQLESLGSDIGVRCCTIVGGVDMMSQSIALARKPHIIVASPGRIVDHLENSKGFNLSTLKMLILDEADRLLNLDFEREIDHPFRDTKTKTDVPVLSHDDI